MSGVNKFPEDSNFAMRIVVGGHEGDPAPDQSGTCKAIDPLRHSQNISHKEMPFITKLASATQSSLEQTNFPPEPGTMVLTSHTTGDPTSAICIGIAGDINGSGTAVAGNQTVNDHIKRAAAYATGKLISKGSKSKMVDGALIKEVLNGQEWKNQLTQGLASHAAWMPLAGQILPQLKQIDTAIEQFANIPGLKALANLPGKFANLGDIFKNISSNQMRQATGNLDPNVLAGMNSMIELMAESDSGGGITDGRVHLETLANNAINLLSQATEISDVVVIMQRLQSDTTLHGLDKLTPLEVTVEGVHGNVVMMIDASGNINQTSNSANIIAESIASVASAVGGSQGGGAGKMLFGDAAKLVSEAIGRLPPSIRKKLLENVPKGTKEAKFDDIHGLLLKGINPIKLFT